MSLGQLYAVLKKDYDILAKAHKELEKKSLFYAKGNRKKYFNCAKSQRKNNKQDIRKAFGMLNNYLNKIGM
jgi:hypothetical protein